MEKIIYIILLIILDNDFYKDIKTIYKPSTYDFIINKNIKLNKDYVPSDLEQISLEYSYKDKYLRKEARLAFEEMAEQAKMKNLIIIATSAYRSYDYQDKLYTNYVKEYGKYYADMCSARKGHSEHQTGLSIDISDISGDYDNFADTKEFIWMSNNAYKYGFILRYPKAKFDITGFKYEPWHYRYVGIKAAKYIYQNNITLEEYKKNN